MKKNELTKLRNKDIEELKKITQDKKLELAKVFTDIKAGREKNLKKSKNLRCDIAQVLTIVKEKELIEMVNSKVRVKSNEKPAAQRILRDPRKTQKKSQ